MKKVNQRKTVRSIGSTTIQLLIIASLVTSAIMAGVTPVAADTSEDYTSSWTDNLNGNNWRGVQLDSSGDVYAVQTDTSTVVKLDGDDGSQIWSRQFGSNTNMGSENEMIAVNSDGVYVPVYNSSSSLAILYQLDKSDGTTISSESDASLWSNSNGDDIDEVRAADGQLIVTSNENQNSEIYRFSTTSSVVTLQGVNSITDGPWTSTVDNTGDYYIAQGASGVNVRKQQSDGSDIWTTGPGWLPSGGSTITINGSGQGTDAFVGQNGGEVTKVEINSSDGFESRGWQSDIGGSASIGSSSYDSQYDVVAFGDSAGNVFVRNATDGSSVDTLLFSDTSNTRGVAANNGKLVAIQGDGSIIYWELSSAQNLVTSISLNVDDTTLLDGENTAYDVIATREDSSTDDVTSSSNVAADDTSVVSINEASALITYQSDGSTIVRANYTNQNGDVLWSNVSVETDTPEITLNVNKSSLQYGENGSYTVTNETFGTTTNVSLSASVTSDNTTILTVDESNLQYNAQETVGVANLTAQDGSYTSSEVQIEVTEPQAITYDNWDYLSGGERALLIFSDWTILWLLGSVLVSVMFTKWHRSPKMAVITFGGLSVIGWVTGFVPGFVILSEMIFGGFVFFLIYWSPSGES